MATGNSITYNGVTLEAVSFRCCNRQAILNGPDYLYTIYELHLRGVYNPSYPGNTGNSPPQYDQLIRHKLAQPHQPLKIEIQAGGAQPRVWVEIEKGDTDNGPDPIGPPTIVQIIGTKTWMIDFGIKFSINECGQDGVDPSVLLSNRWDQAQVLDQQYYTAMRTSGRAIFRSDLLAKRQITADQLRDWLLLPVPNSFKREQLNVSQSQDGVAIRYEFTDLQKSVNVRDNSVADVEIYMNLGTSHQGYFNLAAEAAQDTANLVGHTAQAGTSIGQKGVSDLIGSLPSYGKYLSGSMLAGPLTPLAYLGRGINYLTGPTRPGMAAKLAALSPSEVPNSEYTTKIIVYGIPTADLGELVRFAIGVMGTKMPFKAPSMMGTAARLSINAHRRIVTLEYVVTIPPAMLLASAIIELSRTAPGGGLTGEQLNAKLENINNSVDPNSLRSIDGSYRFWTDQPETLTGNNGQTVMAGPNADFANYPKPNQTYGSHPFNLLTAAILGPCGVPANAKGLKALDLKTTTPTG